MGSISRRRVRLMRARQDRGRAAVEASRAAGTLFGAARRTPRAMAPLYEIEAGKLERLRTARPRQ